MNEIELYKKISPQTALQSIAAMGAWFSASGMFGATNPSQGNIIALTCVTEHMTPIEFARTYDIVDNKLRKKTSSIHGEFLNKGGKLKWLKDGEDGKAASIELTWQDQTIVYTFTIEAAQRQGLVREGSNWKKSVGNMLRARAISNGVAMLMPQVVSGWDETDATPAPTAKLLPDPEPVKVVAEPASEAAPVIEAEVVQAPQPEPVAAKSEPTEPVRLTGLIVDTAGNITEDTAQTIVKIFGASITVCMDWLKARRWITDDIMQLKPARAEQIMKNPAGFLSAVTGANVTKA